MEVFDGLIALLGCGRVENDEKTEYGKSLESSHG